MPASSALTFFETNLALSGPRSEPGPPGAPPKGVPQLVAGAGSKWSHLRKGGPQAQFDSLSLRVDDVPFPHSRCPTTAGMAIVPHTMHSCSKMSRVARHSVRPLAPATKHRCSHQQRGRVGEGVDGAIHTHHQLLHSRPWHARARLRARAQESQQASVAFSTAPPCLPKRSLPAQECHVTQTPNPCLTHHMT